jgi:hypothetical protein
MNTFLKYTMAIIMNIHYFFDKVVGGYFGRLKSKRIYDELKNTEYAHATLFFDGTWGFEDEVALKMRAENKKALLRFKDEKYYCDKIRR